MPVRVQCKIHPVQGPGTPSPVDSFTGFDTRSHSGRRRVMQSTMPGRADTCWAAETTNVSLWGCTPVGENGKSALRSQSVRSPTEFLVNPSQTTSTGLRGSSCAGTRSVRECSVTGGVWRERRFSSMQCQWSPCGVSLDAGRASPVCAASTKVGNLGTPETRGTARSGCIPARTQSRMDVATTNKETGEKPLA